MRQHTRTIACHLLSLLLLLQFGGAMAGVPTSEALHSSMSSSQCQNHDGVCVHGASASVGALPFSVVSHNASPTSFDDGGCAAHCATALLPVTTTADAIAPPFIAPLAPSIYMTAQAPDRLDRPPNNISRQFVHTALCLLAGIAHTTGTAAIVQLLAASKKER